MTQPLYSIYGASGYGRGVMPFAREQLQLLDTPLDRLVYVDDNLGGKVINGYPVLTYSEFSKMDASEHRVVIAVANTSMRKKIAERCLNDGHKFWSVKALNTVIMDDVKIGEGAILNPFVTLTSNIKIGQHFHANIYSYVEHDCVIGDYVTFAPAVKCNGNIMIEDHAYIGAGAVIKQGESGKPTVIGQGAVVGMGAVVTKSILPGTTVVGNPAQQLVKS
jgi:sugar O-acyltransferase (sialic acid O-acetyltransferase NeuD family)